MNAVGGTASTIHLVQQFFSHIQRARWFQDDFGIYQLQLQVHLSRCARMINEANGADGLVPEEPATNGTAIITLRRQEATMLDTLYTIQDKLRKAQREAAQIRAQLMAAAGGNFDDACSTTTTTTNNSHKNTMRPRTKFLDRQKLQAANKIEAMKWALYKKDKCDQFIAQISALLLHLERQVNVTPDPSFLLVASPWHLHEAARDST
ncbi:hypothetical protein HDV57DRAFT_498863 [Trichoderma longibrachiatum]|uniref:Prion-inhibition and propagation HeLo domain-containing protein n=1 Tax=Trichoderma longibrachiatum ATCC 18648 TaxID=983965 RepID=A0A2T4C949_TRILO|nr:hypothetical protein M440DRAFT_1399255 [Trichoderma longibrachiatum ATCC 18648]